MSNGYDSNGYTQIENANTQLTSLLSGLKDSEDVPYFTDVIRGYPENVNVYQGTVATSYVKGAGFEQTMSGRNLPRSMRTLIGVIVKGTKTEAHDAVLLKCLHILDKFRSTQEWVTLNGYVRNTLIVDFEMFPERSKTGLLTTGVIKLEHDVNWR